MAIRYLEWDSEFFGYPVGILELGPGKLDEQSFLIESANYRLVYVTGLTELRSSLLTCGDTKKVFAKRPEHKELDPSVSEVGIDQMHRMEKMGRLSGTWSRFALDPMFKKNEFERLYRKWVERSLKKEIAFKTLTVLIQETPSAIITLGESTRNASSIGLFAVAEGCRGRGIGNRLLSAADMMCFERGDTELTVATQGKNELACRVYSMFGFKLKSETYIYNYWNEAFPVQ